MHSYKLSSGMAKITRTIGKFNFAVRKNAPTILLITGGISVIAGIVQACIASTKVEKIVDETKENVEKTKKEVENLPENEQIVEVTKARTTGILKIAKLYLPGFICITGGFACIYGSHSIIAKRSATLAAAYAALEKGYSAYRKRVADKYGEEEEHNIRFGIHDEVVEHEDPNNGKLIKETVHGTSMQNDEMFSEYARFFDESSREFRYISRRTVAGIEREADTEANIIFLLKVQDECNRILKRRGHLFLNEVYDMLDLKRSVAGQFVGWVYRKNNPNGDNQVDFGLRNANYAPTRRFVNQLESIVLLDFNVDGDIINTFLKGEGDWAA